MTFHDQGVTAPVGFRTEHLIVRPIELDDVALDYEAVMSSRQSLRIWEQSTWPEDDFTVEDNRADLVKMVERHADGYAFGYTVMPPDESQCLGCIYVFATDANWLEGADVTSLVDAAHWSDVDAVVSFWVRESRVVDGLDRELVEQMRMWFSDAWNLERAVFLTAEGFAQQVAMLDASGLERCFRLVLADDAGTNVAYA